MDIQKERESFEAWHYEQYLLENPNMDISNAKYIYDYAHKNVLVCQLRESHFTAWQAAKAQAIPEGFVLVPKEPTDKTISRMINTPIEVNLLCDHADIFLSEGEACIAYQAMIEAQEPAND